MTKSIFITRYNYKPVKGIINTQESKTYQECKDDCDINVMYRKYLSKGFTPPNIAQLEMRYADISEAKTYEDAMNIQEDVKQLFDKLPSQIREDCDYNVDNFIELISSNFDDEKLREFQGEVLETLGMLDRKEALQEIQTAIDEGKIADVEPPKDVITEK